MTRAFSSNDLDSLGKQEVREHWYFLIKQLHIERQRRLKAIWLARPDLSDCIRVQGQCDLRILERNHYHYKNQKAASSALGPWIKVEKSSDILFLLTLTPYDSLDVVNLDLCGTYHRHLANSLSYMFDNRSIREGGLLFLTTGPTSRKGNKFKSLSNNPLWISADVKRLARDRGCILTEYFQKTYFTNGKGKENPMLSFGWQLNYM